MFKDGNLMTLPSKAKKTYGPYKGSKQNGGRKIMIKYDPKTQKTTSTNAARDKKEKELGRKLSKDEHVDHKDNNKHNEGSKNLQVMKASKNIGKGNQHRKKK
jgi:hypothetical protein